MIFWHTARAKFDNNYSGSDMPWEKYIEWSRLTQLTELISLDGMLNELLVKPDHSNEDDWNYIITDGDYETGFYKSRDYVLSKIDTNSKFNLIMAVKEPEAECSQMKIDDYDFIGYELLDEDYGISALSNCGGFDETFLPSELNQFGLISNRDNAFDIRKRLLENNPDEHHADCNVLAVWRHKTLGND